MLGEIKIDFMVGNKEVCKFNTAPGCAEIVFQIEIRIVEQKFLEIFLLIFILKILLNRTKENLGDRLDF